MVQLMRLSFFFFETVGDDNLYSTSMVNIQRFYSWTRCQTIPRAYSSFVFTSLQTSSWHMILAVQWSRDAGEIK